MVRVDGLVWTLTAQLERARIQFSEDGDRQTVLWEWRPFDDEWLPLCDRVNIRGVKTHRLRRAKEAKA